MADTVDVLELRIICPPAAEVGLEVRPIIGGRDVFAGSRYRSVRPRHLLGSAGPLRATATPREVRIATTGCAEECCGAVHVTIRREAEHVLWTGWRNPMDDDFGLPACRFSAAQYDAEVARAEADRRWQWPGTMVADLLEAKLTGDGSGLAAWDCELEAIWDGWNEPDRIDVVLRHPRGCDEREDHWLQFGIRLPITADDPVGQAERLEARLTSEDPRATAQVWGGSPAAAEKLGYRWPPEYPWDS
ncbi:hypothetical protein [Streptomyces rubellomurinus]|uniref:hypothetical protein n=1 Tax=Streptomyces rubellomurinus (strain ATCC 31215) TaxID=359131 RepID=UPI001FCA480A|nr:hypothetical protein [Streptomyces rubellomurinus]